MIRWIVLGFFCLAAAAFPVAQAHEVRPAYLKVTEVSTDKFDVSWKQPILDGRRLRLAPSFPSDCETVKPQRTITAADSLTKIWQIACPLEEGHIAFDGLEATLTDIFVQIEYLTREPISAVVKPVNPKLDISVPSGSPAKAYLGIGVEHVAFGWDHLLFIIGLTLLVTRRQIIGVATAFTLAHSLTLAITALGFVTVPSRPVEILIAASIVMLAVEIMKKRAGQPSLAARKPWIIAAIIGLIHGLGFAGALASIGLPKGDELLALLLFNIGVEIGQIAVILITLLWLYILAKIAKSAELTTRLALTYAIGTIGAFWMITRLSDYIVD